MISMKGIISKTYNYHYGLLQKMRTDTIVVTIDRAYSRWCLSSRDRLLLLKQRREREFFSASARYYYTYLYLTYSVSVNTPWNNNILRSLTIEPYYHRLLYRYCSVLGYCTRQEGYIGNDNTRYIKYWLPPTDTFFLQLHESITPETYSSAGNDRLCLGAAYYRFLITHIQIDFQYYYQHFIQV